MDKRADFRYQKLFEHLGSRSQLAFIPFLMLADPTPKDNASLIETLIAAGADALELGIGFSDPVADGPVIEAAHHRALQGGPTFSRALEQISDIRAAHPELPIGILTYANMLFSSDPLTVLNRLSQAGADSVLVADLPVREGKKLVDLAKTAGICPVFIAPPGASDTVLQDIAALSQGYIYAVSRPGITGVDNTVAEGGSPQVSGQHLSAMVGKLKSFSAPPIVQGFGISCPQQVLQARERGLDGVIAGSALVRIIAKHIDEAGNFDLLAASSEIKELAGQLKTATFETK